MHIFFCLSIFEIKLKKNKHNYIFFKYEWNGNGDVVTESNELEKKTKKNAGPVGVVIMGQC